MASAAVATATSSSSSSSITMSETRASSGSQSSQTMETNGTGTPQHPSQPQHHNQQQHHEPRPAAAVEAETSISHRAETSLPGDLRRILLEVARTGACSWLSWDQDTKELSPSEYAAAASSPGLPPHPPKASVGGSASLTRQAFSTHRRSSSSPFAAAVAQAPPRKKHRNGLHKTTRRRFAAADATAGRKASGGGRKRPLFLIRTHPNTTANANAFSAPGSVGSGRTSGSEPDDSTQYECDSEGTSATTNSEVSVERLRKTQQRVSASAVQAPNKIGSTASIGDDCSPSQHYKTLQEAFRVALGLVLDHFYRRCGGYKLSPAEKRRNQTLSASSNSFEKSGDERRIPPLSPEDIFHQRRQRLVSMLLPESGAPEVILPRQKHVRNDDPPFTIQRIAEVLVSPERVSTVFCRRRVCRG
jgi:hypothetical protein